MHHEDKRSTAHGGTRADSWRQHAEGNRTIVAWTAAERTGAVLKLILALPATACIRVCFGTCCRRPAPCCAKACMTTELSRTAIACREGRSPVLLARTRCEAADSEQLRQ